MIMKTCSMDIDVNVNGISATYCKLTVNYINILLKYNERNDCIMDINVYELILCILGSNVNEDLLEPFLHKENALTYLQKKSGYIHGYYQGIVCECCVHQCTVDELKGYCL